MTEIFQKYSLKNLNTFGLSVYSNYFVSVHNVEEVIWLNSQVKYKDIPRLILGGGSNLLFTKNFDGIVIHPDILDVEEIDKDDNYVYFKVGAGVIWDEFVSYTVLNNYGGLENLSMIPGNVGACPIQNIGAYGSEVKDTIFSVEGVNLDSNQPFQLSNAQCKFDYRNSIFKNELKNKTIITHVVFKLSLNPKVNISYGNIAEKLKSYKDINIQNVRKAIMDIRSEKLPDPTIIGNAGSFFKNPVVKESVALQYKNIYPDMPLYTISKTECKISAAWLIEKCGWKGYRRGDAGTYPNQCLVLVNYGKARGEEIILLADKIISSVKEKFKIVLDIEVNVI